MEKEQNEVGQTSDQPLDQSLNPTDEEYVLDDGTEIRASQIHFDNEDAPIDLTLETLPFTKINDEVTETEDGRVFDDVSYKITASPIRDEENTCLSSLPFKLVCNNTTGFEAQFTRYLEENTKICARIKEAKEKSPRSLIKDSGKEEYRYTREEVLNMLKDSPVTSIYEVNDKRHVRKTDPTRMLQKSSTKAIDIEGLVIGDNESKICFICGKSVVEKLYVFDKEDQKIHRCSPQKIMSMQLKVICEMCLKDNFKPSRMKGANQSLSSDEYLVIRNNQQYIFEKTSEFQFRVEETKQDEFVKVEIGSDGEIVTRPIDVLNIKDERKDNSSDLEIVDGEPDIDRIIDNLDEADDQVKQFLGQGEGKMDVELKCRFCGKVFKTLSEVTQHGEIHKHVTDDDVILPCPLCDYGYPTLKWLKGHIKAAHERKDDIKIDDVKDAEKVSENSQRKEANVEPKLPDLIIKTEVKQECLTSDDDEIWIVQTGDGDAGELGKILQVEKGRSEEKKEGIKKGHKCYNCSQIFPTPAILSSHKCRRVKKGKSQEDTVCIRNKEDFIKRAQGRPRQVIESSSDIVEKQKKKVKDHSEIVTCNDCNQSFTSKVRLKFHMRFHGETALLSEGVYKCEECENNTFSTETELFDHIHFRHDKKKRWHCPVGGCGKTFHLRATLTKHSRKHTDTRRYVCVKCGKRFLDKQTLDEHGVTHLQIKPYQCHICLKQLTRVSRLRMHVRAHRERAAPARTPVCAHCYRAFADLTQAQEHALKSKECIEAFTKETKEDDEPAVQLSPTSGLVRHTIQVIQSPEPLPRIERQVSSPLAAPFLSQLAASAWPLIRVVEIDKAFRCEYCEDVFYIEEGLNRHRKIHKGVKNPFTCHICKVSFTTYSRCTTHKTTHGFYKQGAEQSVSRNDFPVVKHFLCEDCDRSYLHWTYLQVHRRMKHPVNDNCQHRCTHCDVTFPNSWSLAYHRRKIHPKIGQNPKEDAPKTLAQNYKIPCRDCDEVLPNKNALYKHRKKEHSDPNLMEVDRMARPWACSRCPKRFKMRSELKTHTRSKHPHHIAVIEIQGLNPSTDEVMNIINLNNISQNRVIEINIMTFSKGTTNIVPNCARALSMLSNEPKTQIHVAKPMPTEHTAVSIENSQINHTLTAINKPIILQRMETAQVIDLSNQNQEDLSARFMIPDGVVFNNSQTANK